MASYLCRVNEAMEKLMTVDKKINDIQLNSKQVEFLRHVIQDTVQIKAPAVSSQDDQVNLRELCFAVERAEVLMSSSKNLLQGALLQTDLTEEISTLVSFFLKRDTVKSFDKDLDDKLQHDLIELRKKLEARTKASKGQEGDLAAYLLGRLYEGDSNCCDPKIPSKENHWEVETSTLGNAGHCLGKGTSGFVYETMWLGERFARKFFPGTSNLAFEKEAPALVDLRHLNIVHTFCWSKDRRSYSLVIENFGTDLQTFLQRKKGKKEEDNCEVPFGSEKWLLEAVRIMLQIASGMEYLHEKGVAHGDLEPNNVLVKAVNPQREGHLHVKVVDFGLSRTKLWRSRYSGERQDRGFAIRWKAPEQISCVHLLESSDSDTDSEEEEMASKDDSNQEFGALAVADVYSFANICSYILTGEVPFRTSHTPKDLQDDINSGRTPDLPPLCPPPLKNLLHRCWNKKAADRPSFTKICQELRFLISHSELILFQCHIMLCLLIALATCDRTVKCSTECVSKLLLHRRMFYSSFCLDDISVSFIKGEPALKKSTYCDMDVMNCI